MGKRTTSRRLAMQALFLAEQGKVSIEKALDDVLSTDDFLDDTKEFAVSLASQSYNQKEELDQLIKEYLKDWSLDRLSGVDRNILRLAFCELKLKQSPESVVINEALNLAGKYSAPESVKFINGVLGAYSKCGRKKA